jgi:hypothetical protein
MKKIVDEYEFDFPLAISLYKFDETDKLSPHYHGANMMKAVDVIVEFASCYLWIEIKHYTNEDIAQLKQERDQKKSVDTYHIKNYLRNNLVRKYRDTFLYRYAEKKLDKSIIYICLLNFDSALKSHFRRELERDIPVKIPTKKWKRSIIKGLLVISAEDWERNIVLSSLGTCKRIE